MTHYKKHSALQQWQKGSKKFALYTSKLVMIEKSLFSQATSQIPLSHFEGVVIRANEAQGIELYLKGKPCTAHVLLDINDEYEIIAQWRSLGEKTQLPLLIEHENGLILPAQHRLGKLVVAKTTPRRRGFSTLNSRRPLAPMRRKGFAKVLAKAI